MSGRFAPDLGTIFYSLNCCFARLHILPFQLIPARTAGGKELGSSVSKGGLGPLGDLLNMGGKSGGGLDDILGMVRKFF